MCVICKAVAAAHDAVKLVPEKHKPTAIGRIIADQLKPMTPIQRDVFMAKAIGVAVAEVADHDEAKKTPEQKPRNDAADAMGMILQSVMDVANKAGIGDEIKNSKEYKDAEQAAEALRAANANVPPELQGVIDGIIKSAAAPGMEVEVINLQPGAVNKASKKAH